MRRSAVLLSLVVMLFSVALVTHSFAADSMSMTNVSAKKVVLSATSGIDQVKYFTLDSPKRLVVDLYGVAPGDHNQSAALTDGFKLLRSGPLDSRTRFVFDVEGDVFPTFNVAIKQDEAIVTWERPEQTAINAMVEPEITGKSKISAIDFSSDSGQSLLNITVDGNATVTKPTQSGRKVQFSVNNATLPRALRREFDTLSFPSAIYSATPYLINAGGNPVVKFVVLLKGDQPYQLRKSSNGFVFSVVDGEFSNASPAITGTLPMSADGTSAPLIKVDGGVVYSPAQNAGEPVPVIVDSSPKPSKKYTGEKTSLVFDNADIRDILRLIAEISDLNIIASDEVKGNVTLRLIDVPWDQALDLILDVTGLGMVQEGNVARVLPKETIRSMEEAELTAKSSQEKLEPLVTEVVTVSYADLKSVSGPMKDVLSDRGTLTEDSRNKYLIITDIPQRIEKAKELISILDTPERQVLIEARIVEVNSTYSRDLGVNWGLDFTNQGTYIENAGVGLGGDFLLDLPSGAGSVADDSGLAAGITLGRIGIDRTILDLRISALQSAGKLKIVSLPKVTTLNGETATISQGTTIPYETTSSEGTKTEFVSAELKLEVTPVINPDDSIIMEVLTTNDSPSTTTGASAPSIDTKKAETKVLLHDGETTVIGGIFVENVSEGDSGTPLLMDIPILGYLFKSNTKSTSRAELLIFITPRIVKEN